MNIKRYCYDKNKTIKLKRCINGGVDMKGLDINKLRKEKKFTTVSFEDAIKDVTPIDWSEEVLEGKRKVEVNFMKG